jgi:cellulose synthase/poly-beta-1,6-N-acetylglucosamine synthase-like glycosyltransferase
MYLEATTALARARHDDVRRAWEGQAGDRKRLLLEARRIRRAARSRRPAAVTPLPPAAAPPDPYLAWASWADDTLALGLLPRVLPGRERHSGPRIAVLIPAHNEAKGIAATLRTVLAQTRLPDFITVVAHNCTDDTAAIAGSFPGVEVIELNRKSKERKTAPLNWGMDRLLTILDDRDLIMAMDADTRLSPDLIARAEAHFAAVPRLGAAAAHHLVHSPRGLLQHLQAMEMERGRRSAVRRGGRRTCMSGMASMFRVEALLQIHHKFGRIYEPWNSTEDWGLTFAMKDTGWLDRRPPDLLLTYTPVDTWKALFQQRERWGRGYWETLRYFKFRRFTAWPWLLQMWWFFSTACFFLFAGLESSQHHAPRVTTSLVVVTSVMLFTAMVTVRGAGFKAMLIAVLMFPEMAYTWVINFATICGIGKNLLRKEMQWADVRER